MYGVWLLGGGCVCVGWGMHMYRVWLCVCMVHVWV